MMISLIQIHGGADHGNGLLDLVTGLLTFLETLAAQDPGGMGKMLMPGLSAMPNVHPLLVHFPIALLTVFFWLDVVALLAKKPHWRDVAAWFLYFGTATAGLTVLAGLCAAASIPHGGAVHDLMERHEQLGISVLVLATLLTAWRLTVKNRLQGVANGLFLAASALMWGLLALGADLGGLMVYQYGVAVTAVPVAAEAAGHQHSH